MGKPLETPMVRLGDVASFVRGVTFKPTDVEEPTESNVDCMRTKNVQSELDRRDVWSVPRDIVKRPDQLLRAGDLLVSSANSWNLVGKACWIPELERPTTFGGFVSVLRPQKVDPRYLFRWFCSDIVQTTLRSFGNQTTNISNLDLKRAGNLRLPLPHLDEQRRIAAILDKADELRTQRRQTLAHLDTLTQSIFHSMFGSLTEKTPLGDVVNVRTGGTPSRADASNYGGVIPWVKTTEVRNEAIIQTSEHLTDRGLQSSNCSVFPATSVLIAMYGQGKTRGQVGLLLTPAATNQACAVLLPAPSVDALFLFHQLKGLYAEIRSLGRGGNQENLNLSLVKGIPIRLPPLELQQMFATRVAAIERLKDSHRQHLTELDTLFASLQHRAFKGEL